MYSTMPKATYYPSIVVWHIFALPPVSAVPSRQKNQELEQAPGWMLQVVGSAPTNSDSNSVLMSTLGLQKQLMVRVGKIDFHELTVS